MNWLWSGNQNSQLRSARVLYSHYWFLFVLEGSSGYLPMAIKPGLSSKGLHSMVLIELALVMLHLLQKTYTSNRSLFVMEAGHSLIRDPEGSSHRSISVTPSQWRRKIRCSVRAEAEIIAALPPTAFEQ
jgi:hypothetical protein